MPLTLTARNLVAALLAGEAATSQAFSSANAYLCVGDSTETFAASQNQAGTSGANFKALGLDGGFPTRSSNLVTWQATFQTSDANFHWQEWLVRNNSTSGTGGVALNRKQEDLGTKASTQSWAFSAAISITT